MFANARLQTVLCTTDLPRAGHFFAEVLGLPLIERAQGALVFAVGGQPLRVSPVAELEPSIHTVLGFAVDALDPAIERLARFGVGLERFAQLPQGIDGVLTLPDGTRVAWFRDPDRNLLSVVQYPA